MLYIIATPIGNLGDISLRALEALREVDLIASEDTRHTGKLLAKYEIKKPQIAYHEHNEDTAVGRILQALDDGQHVAMVSDAGTPGISDPGYTLVRAASAAGYNITMIPGPTALIMALVLSGLPTHSFTFRGFPPKKSGKRRKFMAIDQASPHTLIFYESPHRLAKFLTDALAVYGDRPAAIANDLTKLYEQVQRGRLSQLLAAIADNDNLKGEYVVVIGGVTENTPPLPILDEEADDDD